MGIIRFAILFSLSLALLAPDADAQRARLGREYYTDPHHGFEFRYPEEWLVTPVQASEEKRGDIIGQMDGPELATRTGSKQSYDSIVQLRIFKFEQAQAVTRDEEDGSGGLRSRVQTENARQWIGEMIRTRTQLRDFQQMDLDRRDDEEAGEMVKVGRDMEAKHEIFSGFNGNWDEIWDCWTFHLDDYDIVLAYRIAQEHMPKWQRVFHQSAKSFRLVERRERIKLSENPTYAELVAYHEDEVSRTPGWALLESPSKRYLIKTSSTDMDWVEEMIERLENSRDLFERDFPPDRIINHVSVVRICSTLEEFHKYGKTGGGVAGWFSPASTELVIVDFKTYDRNITSGVMTHEGFHQYCHFLFDQAEAHRWFDEGHGDYYGAFEFRGNKAIPHARMKGFSRIDYIRQAIRDNTYTPVAKHVRMNHQEWQSSYGYPQSWSIIYMLRQGMRGEVPSRVWRDEYAEIIPNYMRVLHEEFQEAYEEARQRKKERAEKDGEELEPDDLKNENLRIDENTKQKIWDKAINASWGQIDTDEFELLWKEYVLNYLK